MEIVNSMYISCDVRPYTLIMKPLFWRVICSRNNDVSPSMLYEIYSMNKSN